MTRGLLLDTHAFLWARMDKSRLTRTVREAIFAAPEVFVSVASAWETAIKIGKNKLRLPESFAAGLHDSGFASLPITLRHAEAVAVLPPHHGDPFDRMLIAQAMVEDLVLVSADRQFAAYGVPILWN